MKKKRRKKRVRKDSKEKHLRVMHIPFRRFGGKKEIVDVEIPPSGLEKEIMEKYKIFKYKNEMAFFNSKLSEDLRPEEEQAVQFLVEMNGEAFEAQLYERLGLPRTSLWRMTRRLQRMGIVDIKKVRRQNLISIRKRYELKK